ncbi:MAG: hypothetical protein ABSB87_15620 [Terriglobales bacterium]|jgi:DnaJ-class molecular chaperone
MEIALDKECVNCHGTGIDTVSRRTCEACDGTGRQLVNYKSEPMPSSDEADEV